ncbi:hypothetical protein EGW08_021156 [Elysia chlorotica]|uniref:Uncharacterized protein n=1 Tax=Elysia chlorotica TaxID=188477 RepID=A0A433SP98_ELYCH|nr:hypothetical protein EGW08_021156 [Elysia chlorotica]
MEACAASNVSSLSLELDRVELSNTIRYQMSSVLAMAFAYKMRISAAGGDGSRLVLQSLVPSSSVSARTSESPGLVSASSKLVGRRYSGAQNNQARGEISGEVAGMPGTHSDQLLQMFSSSLQTSPHPRLPDLPAVSATGPMSGSSADGLTNSTGGMRRQGSSPVLSSMAHQKGSLVQGYLRRRASSSALSSVSESGVDNSVVATTSSSSSSSSSSKTTPSSVVAVVRDTDADTSGELVKKSRAITPAVPTSGLQKDSSVDATDGHGSKGKGYGILNSTRRFGAWLGKVTHGEKMEVSKKDLNVFAPTSF